MNSATQELSVAVNNSSHERIIAIRKNFRGYRMIDE
jgi:hypothetical protein